MITIKIIDLLNKIANGEEVPKKIKYRDKIYSFEGFLYKLDPSCLYPHIVTNDYVLYCNTINNYILDNYRIYDNINEEVEILEEEKKILGGKKIPEKINEDIDYIDCSIKLFPAASSPKFNYKEKVIINKINKIIDYLESKEKGE